MRNCRETTLRDMTTRLQQRTACGEKESAGSVCILLIFILIVRRPDIRSLDAFYSFSRRPHPFAFVGTREGVDARAQTNTPALSSRSATTGVTSWPPAADEASSAFRGRTRRTGADQPHSRSKPIAKDWEEAVDSDLPDERDHSRAPISHRERTRGWSLWRRAWKRRARGQTAAQLPRCLPGYAGGKRRMLRCAWNLTRWTRWRGDAGPGCADAGATSRDLTDRGRLYRTASERRGRAARHHRRAVFGLAGEGSRNSRDGAGPHRDELARDGRSRQARLPMERSLDRGRSGRRRLGRTTRCRTQSPRASFAVVLSHRAPRLSLNSLAMLGT